MGDYRRMGSVEQHLGNATSTTLFHRLSDLWKSPRGTVLRIEALALVAIVLSLLLAAFGSCRRWSNRWIIQKGFLAAQALTLSLGTYSIGLMQSSSVRSEMYPIWAVSLLTLFGCVDPVTTYIGLDYKGPLLKLIFQVCLYCGYVLLMSVPTMSGGNLLAIGVLSAITFIKGCHRSMAFVLPSRTREQLEGLDSREPDALAGDGEGLMVHLPIPRVKRTWDRIMTWDSETTMSNIREICNHMLGDGGPWLELTSKDKEVLEDVCLGCSLSLLLRRRFLGLDTAREMDGKRRKFEGLVRAGRAIDYKRTLKAIEIELAFLYEVLFTSNEFLHFYEAKTSSFWALASFICICFVGVVATIIPASTTAGPGAGTGSSVVVVGTTATDLVMTLAILVSLALVQFVQLIQCWASNWARVAFACEYAATQPRRRAVIIHRINILFEGNDTEEGPEISSSWWPWMRLKAFVLTRINWFDKWLWQDKLGQYSLHEDAEMTSRPADPSVCMQMCFLCWICCRLTCGCLQPCHVCLHWICDLLSRMLGLQYIRQVLRELWGSGYTGTGAPVGLHDDVKASIVDFLGKIKSRRIGKEWWSSLVVDNGLADLLLEHHLPYTSGPLQLGGTAAAAVSDAYGFTHRVMMWHIATCYCEAAEQQGEGSSRHHSVDREKNQRVAILLSKYCAYLVVSAPELLPGPSAETKRAFLKVRRHGEDVEDGRTRRNSLLEAMKQRSSPGDGDGVPLPTDQGNALEMGVYLGKLLRRNNDPWKVLALLWVQTLLYAAPYGNAEAHMQRLSQGGEFITHLWALLYHIGIDKWEYQETKQEEETIEREVGKRRRRSAGAG